MSDPIPLQTPAGFAPAVAIGLDDGTGHLSLITPMRPLPVTAIDAATAANAMPKPDPLEGETATATLLGPFEPALGQPVYVTLSGEWTGTVRLLRSTDDGATTHGLTLAGAAWAVFSGNACEPVWQETEDAATLWLDCEITAGTLAYRVSQ